MLDDIVDFETLMREHDHIAEVASTLVELCGDATARARESAALLDTLAILVAVHVTKEDRAFYPHLIHSQDRATAAIAEAVVAEFRGLLDSWSDYVAHWSEERIAHDWPGFVADTHRIVALIDRRVQQENELLYPIALREGHIRLRRARAA